MLLIRLFVGVEVWDKCRLECRVWMSSVQCPLSSVGPGLPDLDTGPVTWDNNIDTTTLVVAVVEMNNNHPGIVTS